QPDCDGERPARGNAYRRGRRAGRSTSHRAGQTAGSAEDLLRKRAKSHRGTLRRRPEGAGETVRQGYDQGRCRPLSFRGPARAPRPVDRLCALQRCRTAVVEVRRDADILGKPGSLEHRGTLPLFAVSWNLYSMVAARRSLDDRAIAGYAVQTA